MEARLVASVWGSRRGHTIIQCFKRHWSLIGIVTSFSLGTVVAQTLGWRGAPVSLGSFLLFSSLPVLALPASCLPTAGE